MRAFACDDDYFPIICVCSFLPIKDITETGVKVTIQHDSMVHDGVCSTKCQHAQPRDDSSTQPMDGLHAQPRDGPWPHARTKHVREDNN